MVNLYVKWLIKTYYEKQGLAVIITQPLKKNLP